MSEKHYYGRVHNFHTRGSNKTIEFKTQGDFDFIGNVKINGAQVSTSDIIQPKGGYYPVGAFTTALVVLNDWTYPTGATITTANVNFTILNNKITYTGVDTVLLTVSYSVFAQGGATVFYNFGISVDDAVPETETIAGITLTLSAQRCSSLTTFITLSTGQFLKFGIQNPSSTDGFTVDKYFVNIF